jgi:uncharacterized membrane protein YhaH (DUF805 family)
MTFTQAIRTCLRKYFTFSGRASRPEFWYFFLFTMLVPIGTTIIESSLGYSPANLGPVGASIFGTGAGPLTNLFNLAIIIPLLSSGWRRMHDTGRSGLFLIYPLIAITGLLSFTGFTGAILPLESGDSQTALEGLFGIILFIGTLIAAFSPLLVIWWLTRPSTRGSNKWGPNPHEVSL